ncbi:MAG: outer membrane lipoprotein-sorting protein, partial [Verrucomicrobiales bacterium]|nr:outer membrane lipoprotein-sorting protein [Verrucomicrobiales bacterium]
MIRFRSVFLLSAAAILAAPVLPAQDSALLAAEQARGVLQGKKGVKWTVRVNSTGGDGGEKSAKFEAISQGGKVFAEIEEPADAKGRKYIAEADGKMWFWKPGLTRPVSVSKRQRLTGDAAIGDIASTSFVEGYKVKGKTDGTLDGEPVTVYTMSANSLGDTYK